MGPQIVDLAVSLVAAPTERSGAHEARRTFSIMCEKLSAEASSPPASTSRTSASVSASVANGLMLVYTMRGLEGNEYIAQSSDA